MHGYAPFAIARVEPEVEMGFPIQKENGLKQAWVMPHLPTLLMTVSIVPLVRRK
jgi:hypothetical protein